MNKNLRKKIKHLRLIMLEYADERLIPGYVPEFLEEDFEVFVGSADEPVSIPVCTSLLGSKFSRSSHLMYQQRSGTHQYRARKVGVCLLTVRLGSWLPFGT